MMRRCSHCSHNGHNSRTCPSRGGVKLFGVHLTDGSIHKSASMGNRSASSADGPEPAAGAATDGYASEDFVKGSSASCRERKRAVGIMKMPRLVCQSYRTLCPMMLLLLGVSMFVLLVLIIQETKGDYSREEIIKVVSLIKDHENQLLQIDTMMHGIAKTLTWEKNLSFLFTTQCKMPFMNGYEATRRIREEERNYGLRIPIIALTAHASPEEERKTTLAGMDFHLTKPLQTDQLLYAINTVIKNY